MRGWRDLRRHFEEACGRVPSPGLHGPSVEEGKGSLLLRSRRGARCSKVLAYGAGSRSGRQE